MFSLKAKVATEAGKTLPTLPGRRADDPAPANSLGPAVWFDRIVIVGLGLLVVFSPLAIGSVNPWALGIVEAIIFLLTVVWMARLAVEDKPGAFPGLRPLLIPAGLFLALVLLQLVPLPPAVARALSPSTYRLYAASLPGWPAHDGYPNPSGWHALSRWRPLSIAPSLTTSAALRMTAYACLFFMILCYPLRSYPHSRGEGRLFRRLLKMVLITGLGVACIGLLEQTYWNGAILWFYVPWDWGQPQPGLDPRAAGPFVNPNHFAAYLNLILPLALGAALFQTFLSRRASARAPLRLLCAAGASIAIAAIALSQSRGAWLGGLIAASIVMWIALTARWRGEDGHARRWVKITGPLSVVLLLCAVAGSALYTAPAMPTAVDTRLAGTIDEPDFFSRLGYWRDTLPLIRDFPAFGAGLGCFQDIFPRYQSPPWSPVSVREAHNDYLEMAAETGMAGIALMVWFFLTAGIRIYRGLRAMSSEVVPVVAALIAGLAAIAVQEFFDFALQVPANAVLFTIFVAVAVRLSGGVRADGSEPKYAASRVRCFAALTGLAAIILAAAALAQNKTPYPYLPALPRDVQAARDLIREHPARSAPHLWYAELQHGSAGEQIRELAIAASLEPINPLILDRYAQALAANGQTGKALAVLAQSVFVYPSMEDHFYLQPEAIPWLSIEERSAIDAGFRKAVARGFSTAGPALATFYAAVHHDAAEAEVLTQASSEPGAPAGRAQLLLEAGDAYLRADEVSRAASAFRQAARIDPASPEPYQYLATRIFAPRKDIYSARAAIQRGLAAGADPFALYLALAQVYEQLGDVSGAAAALLDASRSRPGGQYDYDTLMRLADLERRASHFDRAAMWIREAIEVKPGSAGALYELALAEEEDYAYGQALRDLARAIKLAPGDTGMRNHYRELTRMIAAHAQHQPN